MKRRFLVLSDGTVFEGRAFGADTDAVGELVFTTGMNGYIETLTDPSYFGQIVLQTYPLIGNYGMIPADFEGKCHVRGYAVREYCTAPSNFRCEGDLDTFLKEQGVPGICGIDTRAVTRRIREEGVMNARLCDSVPNNLESIRRPGPGDGGSGRGARLPCGAARLRRQAQHCARTEPARV